MILYGSVCSGIEAATQAWHPLGMRAAWFAEIEPFPSAVLAHHYPNVPNHGDMTKLADDVLAKFQAYGLALLAVDEGGDDGEGELFEAIDSARGDLQEALVDLRSMVYEFRKRSAKSR